LQAVHIDNYSPKHGNSIVSLQDGTSSMLWVSKEKCAQLPEVNLQKECHWNEKEQKQYEKHIASQHVIRKNITHFSKLIVDPVQLNASLTPCFADGSMQCGDVITSRGI
jgi:hypothetical protein